MKLKRLGALLVLFVLGASNGAGCSSEKQQSDAITLGVIAPFSGAAVGFGQDIEQCVAFTIKEINDAGGVLGQELDAQYFDTMTDPETARGGLQGLQEDGVSVVIGPSESSTLLAVQQYAHENELLLISPTATSPEISALGDFVWRTVPSDAFQGGLAARVAIQNGWMTASVLHLESSYGVGLGNLFQAEFENLGGTVLASESIPLLGPDQLEPYDFEPVVHALLKDEPDVLYMVTAALDAAAITWQIAAEVSGNYMPGLIGGGNTPHPAFLANANLQVVEDMLVTSTTVDRETESYQTFDSGLAQYLGGSTPVQPWCAWVYDAVYLAALAIERAGGSDGKTVSNNLLDVSEGGEVIHAGEWQKGANALAEGLEIDYQGASGSLKFDVNGDVVEAFYEVLQIQNGAFATLEVVKYE